ncbi:MAG TPA: trehalase family glycosidase [Candidatus Lokiarchaeia archaeon]|nr:trehalase family glycosidase [Candidatus Lokiarchaeia archaeon]
MPTIPIFQKRGKEWVARAFDRTQVPEPIFDADPRLVDLYWFAWELAWNHVLERPGIPQSPYIDCGFTPGGGKVIWIWDSCFMALYCKYAPHIFPGVETLNNFYSMIHDGVKTPFKIEHADNPPLFAWAEWENFRFTGDIDRLRFILTEKQYLQKHFDFIEHTRRWHWLHYATNPLFAQRFPLGFLWSGVASGMDNTPRGRGKRRHMLWLDLLAQQGLTADYISQVATTLGDSATSADFQSRYATIKDLLNTHYWDAKDGIYYDIKRKHPEQFVKVKTPAAFWPMLARMCSSEQAEQLVAKLLDPHCLGGEVPLPSVSRDDPDFDPRGSYWRGGVWLPTAYMATKALERYGYYELADATAAQLVDHMERTYREHSPHTIWELYSPTAPQPGTTGNHHSPARPDFCGWSALGPISMFIENILGFHHVDALEPRVTWRLYQEGRHGIRRLRFGSILADIVTEGGTVEVTANGPFTLEINGQSFAIEEGSQSFTL